MTIKVRKSQLGAYFLFKLITADILVSFITTTMAKPQQR